METMTGTQSTSMSENLREDETLWEAFTQGDCWVLAKYLHDLTGYPIAVIAYKETMNFKHMGVMTPDGHFMDFGGVHPVLDDVIFDYVNGHTDDAVFYTTDISGWEKLRDNMVDEQFKYSGSAESFRYCFSGYDGQDCVYDEDDNIVSVLSIASAIVDDYNAVTVK